MLVLGDAKRALLWVAGGKEFMGRKGHKRRKFKPRKLVKRLLLLAIIFAIGTGIFWLGSSAFRLFANWRNQPTVLKLAQAEQVDDIPGIAAEAVLLRQEIVVLADKPGSVNLVIDAGIQVESGNLVVEVIDKDLLAQLDTEMQKLDQSEQQVAPDSSGLTAVVENLTTTHSKLNQAVSDYNAALRSRAVQTYSTLYNSMTQAAKQAAQLQQDHAVLAKSHVATTEQREQLEQRRQQAIVPVYTPSAGAVYYWADGLEEVAKPANIGAELWEQLQAGKQAQVYLTERDNLIAAGQPLFKVAVDNKTYLLLQLVSADAVVPPEWQTVSVCWQHEGQEALFSAKIIEHEGLAEGQLLLQVEAEEAAQLPRFLDINLHKDGEVYCSIPRGAIANIDGQNVVFILDGSIVRAQPIDVLQEQNKKNVIIGGLKPGTSFVLEPTGLSDGQDVTDRLRK